MNTRLPEFSIHSRRSVEVKLGGLASSPLVASSSGTFRVALRAVSAVSALCALRAAAGLLALQVQSSEGRRRHKPAGLHPDPACSLSKPAAAPWHRCSAVPAATQDADVAHVLLELSENARRTAPNLARVIERALGPRRPTSQMTMQLQ
jgi:hypothetical protein